MTGRSKWSHVEKYIKFEIDPIKLLPVLKRADILTQTDREAITATCEHKGASHATQTELLHRLAKRGDKAFSILVAALRETGQDHAAQLLDPLCQETDKITNGEKDERVLEAGVAADIRVKIRLSDPTEEQIKEVKEFCERYQISHSEDAVKLRRHFNDLFDENIKKYINLVKTTYSNETSLVFIFRFSDLNAANKFWEDFDKGSLKSDMSTKLQSFPDKNNCFRDGTIQFDNVIDPDDFAKVRHTLQNPKEGKMLVDGMEKRELILRDDQHELVKPALEGKNTIICAPTGSGKTFVAMEAIKQHVSKPDRKYVVFIVNTVSLVEQQETRLQQYLPEGAKVTSVCGSNPDVSLPSELKENHVVVLTAQVLLNALKKKQITEEGVPDEKHVSISQFSLLVFDECHHTTKEHPYNEIMRWYMTEKFKVPSPNLPQIIGLSASLGIGTGNSGSGNKAETHIMGLCANLDVHELMLNTEDQSTSTKITPISRGDDNVFKKIISDIMTKIQSMMLSVERPVHQHGSQPYENWVVSLREESLDRDIVTCLEQLNVYNSSLMINDEVRSQDALRYLHEKIVSEQSTDMEVELRKLFDSAVAAIEIEVSEPNPGLQTLQENMHEKLSCGNESKGIIFVRTRFVAQALVDWLKDLDDLKNLVKNPTSVVGCGQRNGKVGMNKSRQDNEIKSFRDGDCNVIVATSVLLEGIDIPKCNFVISYGMPGNEITLMQARGRVRANQPGDWQYNIIVPREQVMMKERDLQKEKLMKETIAKVKAKSKDVFKKKVEDLQRKALDDYVRNLARRGSSQALPVPDDTKFFCKKCGIFACMAKHIKLYHDTCRIVPNHEVNLQNFKFKEATSKYMPGGFNKTGKTYCNECSQDWGNRARNEYGEFPMLKITSFRVKRSSGASNIYKQWSEFPYELDVFDPDEHS